jgi:uncharacterized protein (TIGR02466 family)
MERTPSDGPNASTSSILRFSLERVFSLPIGFLKWDHSAELNDQLRELIVERSRVDAGVPLSEDSGWHSRDDLLNWTHAAIAPMRERIFRSIAAMSSFVDQTHDGSHDQAWSVLSWANVMRTGHHVDLHHHCHYHWAGVYYVDSGRTPHQEDCGGAFEIQDPASRRLVVASRDADASVTITTVDSNERLFTIAPEDGLMVIFPGTASHRVSTYAGTRPRISISFNATRADAQPPQHPVGRRPP